MSKYFKVINHNNRCLVKSVLAPYLDSDFFTMTRRPDLHLGFLGSEFCPKSMVISKVLPGPTPALALHLHCQGPCKSRLHAVLSPTPPQPPPTPRAQGGSPEGRSALGRIDPGEEASEATGAREPGLLGSVPSVS